MFNWLFKCRYIANKCAIVINQAYICHIVGMFGGGKFGEFGEY